MYTIYFYTTSFTQEKKYFMMKAPSERISTHCELHDIYYMLSEKFFQSSKRTFLLDAKEKSTLKLRFPRGIGEQKSIQF